MNIYTMTESENAAWYSDHQHEHDRIHAILRERLAAGTEVYDADGIVVAFI